MDQAILKDIFTEITDAIAMAKLSRSKASSATAIELFSGRIEGLETALAVLNKYTS